MSDSVRPHRWQPTRLPHPWDSQGKNTEVGCHFLLQCMKVKSESEVAQSCPTLSDPMDSSLPGSSPSMGFSRQELLTPCRKSYNLPRQHIKKQRHYFVYKCPSSQGYGFSSSDVCESWTIKKAESQRIDALELWCWRRLLRDPWTARKSN